MRALIRVTAFVVVLAVLAACGADRPPVSPFPAATGRGSCAVDTERDVGATMRDGVVLRADVYRPRSSEPVPVLLMRTPEAAEEHADDVLLSPQEQATAMREEGWSNKRIARELDVHPSTVGRWFTSAPIERERALSAPDETEDTT